MLAYVYQAALLCPDCAIQVKLSLREAGKVPDNPMDESTFDSGDYPKGPYTDGGGEADSPCHCDHCHVFLENPLTSDGQEYVKEALASGEGDPEVLAAWRERYDWLIPDEEEDEELTEGEEVFLALGTTSTPERRSMEL